MTTPLVDTHPAEGRSPLAPVRALAVVIALLVLGALVGLVTVDGAASTSESKLAVVLTAAEQMGAAPPMRFVTTAELSFGAVSTPMIQMEGAVDGRTGQAVIKGSRPFSLDVVSDGEVVYARPADAQALPKGRTWVAVAADKLARPSGANVFLPDFSGENPGTAMLALLRGQEDVKDAQEAGRVDVRGTSATEYRVTFDGEQFRRRMLAEGASGGDGPGGGADPGPGSGPFLFGDARVADPVLEVAVGDDGLLRRQRLSLGFDVGNRPAASLVTTTEFFDVGAPVEVRVPPAELVVTAETVEQWMTLARLGGPGSLGGVFGGGLPAPRPGR